MLELFFQKCCDICTICSSIMGLTYGEFCILMFCYIQPIIVLLFGLFNIKHLIGKITIISMILNLWFYKQYSITTDSFYRIYKDLHIWANNIGINYIEINILLYILIPVFLISINVYDIYRNK